MQPKELFVNSSARVVKYTADLDRGILIADKKSLENEKWCLAVSQDKAIENGLLTVLCPKKVMGMFIGKGGSNIRKILYNLAQKGLQVRKVQFIEENNNACEA